LEALKLFLKEYSPRTSHTAIKKARTARQIKIDLIASKLLTGRAESTAYSITGGTHPLGEHNEPIK